MKLLSSSFHNEVDVSSNLKSFDVGTWLLVRCYCNALVCVLEISCKWAETGNSGNICSEPLLLVYGIFSSLDTTADLRSSGIEDGQAFDSCRGELQPRAFHCVALVYSSKYVLVFLFAKWPFVSCLSGKWRLRWRSEKPWWICAAFCNLLSWTEAWKEMRREEKLKDVLMNGFRARGSPWTWW